MTTLSHFVLVLWGQGFDEIAASIFVAELRRLGKRVKLAGLNSKHIAGQHGLTLVPDLSLGQALSAANPIQCLIIPAPLAALQQFSYDPRLAELVGLAATQHALIVTDSLPSQNPDPSYIKLPSFSQLDFSQLDLLVYPAVEELLPFVRLVLTPRLCRMTERLQPATKSRARQES